MTGDRIPLPVRLRLAALIALVLGAAPNVHAQGVIDRNHVPSAERVDPLERRSDNIDGNNIRATITNWAQTAQSGEAVEYWYEWPKNTNREYIALTQLWVGAKVAGSNGDSLWIVNVSDFRSNPTTDESWNFDPVGGYVNPAGSAFGIAQSDEPDSWPPFWPDKLDDALDPGWEGSWNGFFGKNVFNADQEFFFKVGDDHYNRYPTYYPDSTDLTRRGLGLIAETRIMAWSQILIDDVVFLIHGVKNDGTQDLNQVGFSIWLADCVGGDCGDDIPFFSLEDDVAWMTDQDGIGDQNFGGDRVGVAAIAFLETPGNAVDRIDNDADGSTAEICTPLVGECNSPVVSEAFLAGERPANGIDDNGNGLIDENRTHVPFSDAQASSPGVGYADYIDNDGDGEQQGPTVTQAMVADAAADRWNRWPPSPENDPVQQRTGGGFIVHLVGVDAGDVGRGFKDGIDNDNSHAAPTAAYPYLSEPGSPLVTQEMIDAAASDPYRRYRVPGTDIILYDLGPEDLGKAHADGVDNDGDGAVDEGIDEGIDEMIDESRADGLDNDGDWDPLRDDSGLDGVAFSGDPGDGDGQPTTGAGTDFPGERNIDITDVSESDQIGITNVQIFGSGALSIDNVSDRSLFNRYMVPGSFVTELPEPGDNDLVVSSGLFPLQAGQTERISLSVQLGLSREEALQSRDYALQAYLEDYQFAQAPVTPTLRAVAGDGKVTLYWDTDSEASEDPFLAGLGLPFRDFEGYRIYRATDPAFLDPRVITDGFGNQLLRKPLTTASGQPAIFDLINEHEGFHPVDINGVKYYLGNNRRDIDLGEDESGLAHVFVDSTVTNGVTYFYAVTAYDFGAPSANIPPTETPIRIRRLADGTIETGPNVAEVVATPPVAGYTNIECADCQDGLVQRTNGTTSSRIAYRTLDPTVITDGRRFRITFEDTLIVSTTSAPDTLKTKNFSLIDVETGRVLLRESTAFTENRGFPTLDDFGNPFGFQLLFMGDDLIELNTAATQWNDPDVYPITLNPYLSPGFLRGYRNPTNYRVEVVGPGEGQSISRQVTRFVTLPARPTNVRVYRLEPDGSGGLREVEVEYAFWDITGDDFVSSTSTEPATFSADPSLGESDLILVYEPRIGEGGGENIITWQIGLNFVFGDRTDPDTGDEVTIVTRKPFLATDAFEFVTSSPTVDLEAAAANLDQIQVVPNPYVVTNAFEPLNPFSTGRGPRRIKFINLPPQCTVRIFTVSGRLVRTLEHSEGGNDALTAAQLLNGTLDWDLETDDRLTVAYGIYLYHVEAPGIGEKTGTFAIIK